MSTEQVKKACSIVGGQASLARRIGASPSFVYQWIKGLRGVPAEFCPAIERETNGMVLCEDLRPDVPWAVLRCQCVRDEAAHDQRAQTDNEMQAEAA